MSDHQTRNDAETDAALARAQLTATMVDIQARLHPRALIRDAMTELRDAGVEIANGTVAAARRNPGPLIGIGATLIAIFARDWLIDAFAADTKPDKNSDKDSDRDWEKDSGNNSGPNRATASPAPRSSGNDHKDGVATPREGTPDD